MIASENLPHILNTITNLMEAYGRVQVVCEGSTEPYGDQKFIRFTSVPECPTIQHTKLAPRDVCSADILVAHTPVAGYEWSTATVVINNIVTSVRTLIWDPENVARALQAALTMNHPNLDIVVGRGQVSITNMVRSGRVLHNSNLLMSKQFEKANASFHDLTKTAKFICKPVNFSCNSEIRDLYDNIVTNITLECDKLFKQKPDQLLVPIFNITVGSGGKPKDLVLEVNYVDNICTDPDLV